ncbi:MAG TPA: isoaspartyl peptidase/L-asparaginase [Pirellulales bacterium]|nr:isoaspartyl peptidase/L-asparaginase [Pirellulales bacterium]
MNIIRTLLAVAMLSATAAAEEMPEHASDVVLGIHGGIGQPPEDLSKEEEQQIRSTLEQALVAGHEALAQESASSQDAVETAIRLLEDSPLFNAGKGAVFTWEGRNELDAAIMEGRQKRAGAVAGVTVVKNPIAAARAVMEKSKHVMLVGRGAEVFATEAGLEIVDPSYFWTKSRWEQLEEQRKASRSGKESQSSLGEPIGRPIKHEWGTVGAVALDRHGDLAAGTSTGGMSGKRFGRVGDSPIIGAGTYADNAGCAVSCTGHGEYFIRWSVAHEINSLMKYQNLSVEAAADRVINRTLKAAGGSGGTIVLDVQGNFSAAFNTEGLYRGWITRDGKPHVRLFKDR